MEMYFLRTQSDAQPMWRLAFQQRYDERHPNGPRAKWLARAFTDHRVKVTNAAAPAALPTLWVSNCGRCFVLQGLDGSDATNASRKGPFPERSIEEASALVELFSLVYDTLTTETEDGSLPAAAALAWELVRVAERSDLDRVAAIQIVTP